VFFFCFRQSKDYFAKWKKNKLIFNKGNCNLKLKYHKNNNYKDYQNTLLNLPVSPTDWVERPARLARAWTGTAGTRTSSPDRSVAGHWTQCVPCDAGSASPGSRAGTADPGGILVERGREVNIYLMFWVLAII